MTIKKTDDERRVERFLAEKNLPVPVLACSSGGGENPQYDKIETSRNEARRSTTKPQHMLATGIPGASLSGNPRGGQKFNKVVSKREYMRSGLWVEEPVSEATVEGLR